MRQIFIVLLLAGILSACVPSQQADKTLNVGGTWIVSLQGAESYRIETKKVNKNENGLMFFASTDNDRASLISISGERENYSSIIVFVSKSKSANDELIPENINQEEGMFCMAPFSLDKNKIEGFYFRGCFSKFSSFRSTSEFDGPCLIQRM